MSRFPLVQAASVAPASLHAAFGRAFADYLAGPFELPPERWPVFLASQGVDLALSRVVLQGKDPVAFCFVAPRPECRSWRLATMGAVPSARGSGAAKELLDDCIARAEEAGVAAIELECFAQNDRALRLYRHRGFKPIGLLYGYEVAAGPFPAGADVPQEVKPDDAFAWLDERIAEGCELPMQVTGRSLRAMAGELRAWRHIDAQVLFTQAADGRVQVKSLFDRDRAQSDAITLVHALRAQHPDAGIHVPQLQQRQVGGEALERCGFTRLPLHQVWMQRAL